MASEKATQKLLDPQKPILELKLVLCIHYLVQFKEKLVQGLINLGGEINTISSIFAKNLNFYIWRTEVSTKKINGLCLEIL